MITVYLLKSDYGYEELPAEQMELVMKVQGKAGQYWFDVDALHSTTTEWERWPHFPTPEELEAHPPPTPDMTVALYQEDDAWPVPVDGWVVTQPPVKPPDWVGAKPRKPKNWPPPNPWRRYVCGVDCPAEKPKLFKRCPLCAELKRAAVAAYEEEARAMERHERWQAHQAELEAYKVDLAYYEANHENEQQDFEQWNAAREDKRFWEFRGLYHTSFARAISDSIDKNAARVSGGEKPLAIIAGMSVAAAMLVIGWPMIARTFL